MFFTTRMSKRLIVFGLVCAVLIGLSPVGSSQAQGANCFGLGAADCKIISTADANIEKETTFHQDFDLSFSYNGNGQSGAVTAKGDGLIDFDPSTLTSGDTNEALSNLKLTLNIADGTLKTASKTTNNDQAGQASLVIIDGNIYLQTTNSSGEMGEWQGSSLSSLMNGATTGFNASAPNNRVVSSFLSDPQVLKALASIPKIKGFIALKKTTNAPTLDNQKQIEFVYTFDVPTLLKAKELYPVIKSLAKIGGANAGQLSDSQMAAVANLMAKAFNGTTFKVTRWVGSKDNLYHAFVVDSTLNFDGTSVGQTATFSAKLHFAVRLTAVGQPVDIQAPEGVTVQ